MPVTVGSDLVPGIAQRPDKMRVRLSDGTEYEERTIPPRVVEYPEKYVHALLNPGRLVRPSLLRKLDTMEPLLHIDRESHLSHITSLFELILADNRNIHRSAY